MIIVPLLTGLAQAEEPRLGFECELNLVATTQDTETSVRVGPIYPTNIARLSSGFIVGRHTRVGQETYNIGEEEFLVVGGFSKNGFGAYFGLELTNTSRWSLDTSLDIAYVPRSESAAFDAETEKLAAVVESSGYTSLGAQSLVRFSLGDILSVGAGPAIHWIGETKSLPGEQDFLNNADGGLGFGASLSFEAKL
tara:strand:+ start:11760 stop:12344 length:585 start_codon:yes stop_codon:yes gene_type:complete